MVEAYLLIMAREGRSLALANKLMRMHWIRKIDVTQGQYDIVAEIKANSEGKLDNIVHQNIEKLGDVELVSSLIVKE